MWCLLNPFFPFAFPSVRPLAPTLQASPNATTLLQSQTVTLSCLSPKADAQSKYILIHNGRYMKSTGNSGTFNAIGSDQSASGIYECIMQSGGVNSSLSNKVELKFVGMNRK